MLRILGVISALFLSIGYAASTFASEPPTLSNELIITDALADKLKIVLEKNDIESSITLLENAAKQGNIPALLHLAEIYESGKFVPKDQDKACKAYMQAASRLGKVDRFHPQADKITVAYRKAADCYVNGIGTINSLPDMNAGGNLLLYSGVILEDAESLFKLGKLFLSAEGIGPNLGMAVRFLESSARKQYPPAQALFGSMMWEGKITKHRPAAGLALLILGMERTLPKDRVWITTLHDEAMLTASKDIEQEARSLVEKWKAVHSGNGSSILVNTPQNTDVPPPSKSPAHELNDEEGGIINIVDGLTKTTKETHSPASAEAVPSQ